MKTLIKLLTLLTLSIGVANAGSYNYSTTVKVTHSEPIYKTFYKEIPYEKCYNKKYKKYSDLDTGYSYNDRSSVGFDTILGATAGVVIGHQIGKGRGKDVAKVVGGLLGGYTANQMREPRYVQERVYTYGTKRKCKTKYRSKEVTRKVGYKNYFYLDGREFSKVTKRPKRFLDIEYRVNY